MSKMLFGPIRKLIPSKRWCIAMCTAVTIGSAIGYDKYARMQVWKNQEQLALKIASERLLPYDKVRKVHVFVQKSHWAKNWFQGYIKPIFDAAALDYDLYEMDEAVIRAKVKDHILGGWKVYSVNPRTAWEGTPAQIADITVDKYDPSEGIVAIGESQLRGIVSGIEDSFVHIMEDSASTTAIKDGFLYPSIGVIDFTDLSGWENFLARIKTQFVSRYISETSGSEALKICFGNLRDFERSDLVPALPDNPQPPNISGDVLKKLAIYC